jgi:hypothetical protein
MLARQVTPLVLIGILIWIHTLLHHGYPVLSYIHHVNAHPMYVSYSYGGREGEVDDGKDKKDPGGYHIPSHFLWDV